MKQTLEDMQIMYDHPILINCDNTSAINIFKLHVLHSKTKHIPIKYQFLREKLSQKVVKIEYVVAKEQIAYFLTKHILRDIFQYLRHNLGFIPNPN